MVTVMMLMGFESRATLHGRGARCRVEDVRRAVAVVDQEAALLDRRWWWVHGSTREPGGAAEGLCGAEC